MRFWSWLILAAGTFVAPLWADDFRSDFHTTHDRIWIGPGFWANPMEDWRVQEGRLEVTNHGNHRNVALLSHSIGSPGNEFSMSVRVNVLQSGRGSFGFRIGLTDYTGEYQAAAVRGRGLDVGVTTGGHAFIGKPVEGTGRGQALPECVELRLQGVADGPRASLTLRVLDAADGRIIDTADATVRREQIVGLVALVSNFQASPGQARYGFDRWTLEGSAVQSHPERCWGPILWSMHTVSRGVLKMTAQMPPLGALDSSTVRLEIQQGDRWEDLGEAPIDPDACTATFRIEAWQTNREVPYRLVYRSRSKGGESVDHAWTGTVRREPTDRTVAIAGFTGNMDYVFPNAPLVRNVKHHDPDVLFFSGDQIYESVGGYGIIREPADRSILNYLRKWYLLGWAFGDLMRDRVTICLPDDHDVYQGNIWGEGGIDCQGIANHAKGGYAQPARMINAVHRTQTSHHPDLYDPTPIAQGISVFYGDMVYGRVSFAMIADRMFKSGPEDKVNTWEGRPDHLKDTDYDVSRLDKPGLELLGDRQMDFIESWAADWKGADMKIVLSQTIFCNLANYHGAKQEFIFADLDSNGWPQSGRNQALNTLRKGFAFHLAGDQHLPSIVHHGTDEFRDSIWSFCVPSIAAGYPRSWRPDDEGRPAIRRVNGPNTGDYLDAFGNKMTVWAIGNPERDTSGPYENRYQLAHDKASGYGLVRMNKADQTIGIECWRFHVDVRDPQAGDQFPGWPQTIHLRDNYARQPIGHLPEVSIEGVENAVLQVIDEGTGDLVYALRLKGNTVRPWVFHNGPHTVRLGDPDRDVWGQWQGQRPAP
jgi:alkaline phosphatase D